jgi:hypothetical protein
VAKTSVEIVRSAVWRTNSLAAAQREGGDPPR